MNNSDRNWIQVMAIKSMGMHMHGQKTSSLITFVSINWCRVVFFCLFVVVVYKHPVTLRIF